MFRFILIYILVLNLICISIFINIVYFLRRAVLLRYSSFDFVCEVKECIHPSVCAQLAKFEASLKQSSTSTLTQANANKVRVFRSDYCGKGHANSHYEQATYIEETHCAGNIISDPYFNTYNTWWENHSNLKWSNN